MKHTTHISRDKLCFDKKIWWLYIKIRRCGKIANETTLHLRQNDVDWSVDYLLFNDTFSTTVVIFSWRSDFFGGESRRGGDNHRLSKEKYDNQVNLVSSAPATCGIRITTSVLIGNSDTVVRPLGPLGHRGHSDEATQMR